MIWVVMLVDDVSVGRSRLDGIRGWYSVVVTMIVGRGQLTTNQGTERSEHGSAKPRRCWQIAGKKEARQFRPRQGGQRELGQTEQNQPEDEVNQRPEQTNSRPRTTTPTGAKLPCGPSGGQCLPLPMVGWGGPLQCSIHSKRGQNGRCGNIPKMMGLQKD